MTLRILQVLPYYRPAYRYGGPVRSVHELSRALVSHGAEVTVFTTNLNGAADLDVPLGQPVLIDGVHVWYFPVAKPRWYAYAPLLGQALRTQLNRFDVVHINGLFLYPTVAAARASKRQGVPYVVAPRGMLLPEALHNRRSARKRWYLRLIEARTLRQAAAVHFTTVREQQRALRQGSHWHDVVVPNLLDCAAYAPLPPAIDSNTIMFLGRLDSHKRLPLLLAAFAQVRAALPTARLVIAGPDDKGYLAQLRRVAAELHLTPFVHFPGLVEGATKTALFAQASVCVLPSYSENFGMAVVEALAHARPVVVTEGVDIGPEIAEAGAGLVVPPDAGALAGALLQLLRDPVAAHAMGQRGRAMVETRYNADVVATQMLAVYQQLIQTHS